MEVAMPRYEVRINIFPAPNLRCANPWYGLSWIGDLAARGSYRTEHSATVYDSTTTDGAGDSGALFAGHNIGSQRRPAAARKAVGSSSLCGGRGFHFRELRLERAHARRQPLVRRDGLA